MTRIGLLASLASAISVAACHILGLSTFPCTSDVNCRTAEECVDGSCLRQCADDDACDDGLVCRSGLCLPPDGAGEGEGGEGEGEGEGGEGGEGEGEGEGEAGCDGDGETFDVDAAQALRPRAYGTTAGCVDDAAPGLCAITCQ